MNDLRYCLRSLARTPGFSGTVILTLALGIGANTAIFSIVDAVLLRALPFPQPEQLVRVVDNAPGVNARDIGMSVPELKDLQDRAGIFEAVAGVWPIDGNSTGGGRPERIEALAISFNYFELLGVKPALGRLIESRDRTNGFADACVISYDFWQRNFAGDPHVLGKTLREDGDAYTIVGVTAKGFRHPGRTLSTDVDMWAATAFSGDPFPADPQRSNNYIPGAIARLKPGLTVAQAQQRLDAFVAQLRAQYPRDYRPEARFSIQLEPLKDALTGKVRTLLLMLLGAVGMMLLIGCVNIANLLLARAAGRQREIVVRQAMGASRWRLIRQMLTESIVLSSGGGILGILLAFVGTRALTHLNAISIPLLSDVRLDGSVLSFTLLMAILSGLLFGLVPALQVQSSTVHDALKDTSRGSTEGRGHRWIRRGLVVSEVAFACVLLVGAGLLIRSFLHVLDVNLGFQPERAAAVRVDPSQQYNTQAKQNSYFDEVLRIAREIPGVREAGLSDSLPLGRNRAWGAAVKGRSYPPGRYPGDAFVRIITDGYIRAMGIPLIEGRDFTARDTPSSEPVVLINQTMARNFFPGEKAIGQFLAGGCGDTSPRIVGIVGDVRHLALEQGAGNEMYYPMRQCGDHMSVDLVMRTALPPGQLAGAARASLKSLVPNLPSSDFRTLQQLVDKSVSPRRFVVMLLAGFALFALILASLGIYAVISYSVTQRTQEIGIRMALGASAADLRAQILGQTMALAAAGMLLGIVGSGILARAISCLLFGSTSTDPVTFGAMLVVLGMVAAMAGYLPARRASRIDPMVALRAS